MTHEILRSRFRASLMLALVISLATIPWLTITAPSLGVLNAIAWLAIPGIAVYLFVIAPRPAVGFMAGTAASVALMGSRLLTSDPSFLIAVICLTLAVTRSMALYRRSPTRALSIELILGIGSLLVARFLGGSSPLSWGLAIWGYLLTHSLYFLIADLETGSAHASTNDAFVTARDQALRLLDTSGQGS